MSITISATSLAIGLIASLVGAPLHTSRSIQRLSREIDVESGLNENFIDHLMEYGDNKEKNKIVEKYETIYNDKALLLKTLYEHGVENLKEKNGEITCKIESFAFRFTKEENSPYIVEMSYDKNCSPEETLDDISEEYALNVQEETYLKIKENLSKKNLQINHEEIMEDNTIVLTVNLD